jgi:hypothetical protein
LIIHKFFVGLRPEAPNRRLMNTAPEAASGETRRLIEQWGILHAGRSALGLIATLIFLWAQELSSVPRL